MSHVDIVFAGVGKQTHLRDVTLIDLAIPWATCPVCGADTPSRWGVPRHNGDLVSNAFAGEWSGIPAWACYHAHAVGLLDTRDADYEHLVDPPRGLALPTASR